MSEQEKVQITGKILDIELKTTRKSDQMAIMRFLTQEKEIEVVVWPEALKIFLPELKSGKTLTIEGLWGADQEPFTLTDVISSNLRYSGLSK